MATNRLSNLSRDIDEVFSTKPYGPLAEPYHNQNEVFYQRKKISRGIEQYCDLLKKLINDEALWNKFYLRAMMNKAYRPQLRHLRLRYEIVGNVLKTVFMLHNRHKRLVLEMFKLLAVKVFTHPGSNKKSKVVVLQHLGNNRQQAIDYLRPPLPNLSIRSPIRSRASARVENDAIFDSLLNDTNRIGTSRIPREVRVRPIEDIPIYSEEIQPIRQIQRDSIEDNTPPVVGSSQYLEYLRRRWLPPQNPPEPIASGSNVDDQFLYQLEANLQYLRECGLVTEGLVLDNLEELDKIMNETLEQLNDGSLVPPAIPAMRNGCSRVSNIPDSVPETQSARPIPENVEVEPAERPIAQTRERLPRTIADELIENEVFHQEVEAAFLRRVNIPGSIVEIPLADVPFNLEQRAQGRSQSPLAREVGYTLAELERQNPEPPRRSPPRRNKYTLNTNLVISRKLKRIIKPPTFIPHYLAVENEYDEFRHPFNKLIPFDQFELNDDIFSSIRCFDAEFEGLPTAPNVEDNMIYELFEETDDTYFEENELEARIVNLRASLLVPIEEILRETSPSEVENVQVVEGSRLPELLVQPPVEDFPIPAHPQAEDILSNIPVPEPRPSARLSQDTNQPPIDQQPVDTGAPFLPVPVEIAPIPDRISMYEDNVSNIPPINILGTSMPLIQPTIQVVGADVDVEEIVQQKRTIGAVENILPKRMRMTSPQGTVDVPHIPAQIEPQQMAPAPLLLDADPTAIEQPPVPTSMLPQIELDMEPVATAPVDQSAQDDQPNQIDILRRRKERITLVRVLDKLDDLFNQSPEPVRFIELYSLTAEHTDQQKRKIISKVFGSILDLAGMRKVKLDQEPGSWSPEDIRISKPEPEPEPEPTTPRPEPEPWAFELESEPEPESEPETFGLELESSTSGAESDLITFYPEPDFSASESEPESTTFES